jgi:hypothetical protein
MKPSDELLLHGVNGTTGQPLSISVEEALRIAMAGLPGDQHAAELKQRAERDRAGEIGVRYRVDPSNLLETGWAVIFASDEDPKVIEALQPLLHHRRELVTAGGNDHFYQEYVDDRGHLPDESKQQFLERHRVPLGAPADPERMPYYLLIVGDPRRISFQFQYELDVEYAVGRLHFETPEDYRRYAEKIVETETTSPVASPRAVFFGARSVGDRATELSSQHLVLPLARMAQKMYPSWQVDLVNGDQASKEYLVDLFQTAPPALLFTATHGVGFDRNDPRLLTDQGALLCSNWPGTSYRGRITDDFYFRGSDVPEDACLTGLIAFHFACYAAGTPGFDDFPDEKRMGSPDTQIAPRPFVASLPKRLLACPGGGALAVIGHVERAWTCSFLLRDYSSHTEVFEDAIKQILDGVPVGAAMEIFNQKYASLATLITAKLRKVQLGLPLSADERKSVVSLWTMHNDARNYVVIGDPAARLRVC